MPSKTLNTSSYKLLCDDLNSLIETSKKEIEDKVNSILALTYWKIGERICQENLSENGNYFTSIVEQLEADLKLSKSTLFRAVKFFQTYPKQEEISGLSWSHYKYLLVVKDNELRAQIEEKAKEEAWNVSKLNSQITQIKENDWQMLDAKKPTKSIARPTNSDYLYKAKIVKVIDGDTLVLNIDLGFQVIKEQIIRLAQIDAADIETARGKKAFEYLRDLAGRLEEVVVKTNKVDIYGRYLGEVFYSNEDVNQSQTKIFKNGVYLNGELVKKGLVEVF